MFKKRKLPNKAKLRKRQEKEEEDEEDSVSVLERIRLMKDEQQMRARNGGTDAEVLVKAPKTLVDEVAEEVAAVEEVKYGLQDPKEDSNREKLERLLGGSFTGTTDVDAENPHANLMNEYIKEQMGLNNKKEEVPEEARELTEEEKLYMIPDELKGEDKDGRYNKFNAKSESDGGPMAWNTGIAEVSLPIEFKLKNIEDTERMKQRVSNRGPSGGGRYGGRGAKKFANMGTSGNMTANYNHHRKEWAIMMRAKGVGKGGDDEGGKGKGGEKGGKGGGKGYGGKGGKGDGVRQSSDDSVLMRFKKRSRR